MNFKPTSKLFWKIWHPPNHNLRCKYYIFLSENMTPIYYPIPVTTSVGWLSEWGPLIITTNIYPLVLQIFKEKVLVYNHSSQKYYEDIKQLVRKPLVLCQFSHENCKFFQVFEITGTSSSLILKRFQRTWTEDSLLLKYLKN